MKKTILSFFVFLFLFASSSYSQKRKDVVSPTKNIILLIPDGTSMGVISASRYYQIFNKKATNLAIDPYICGTVKTYSINAPIGDSAPTTSCYVTGIPARAGNVAIYPVVDPVNDMVQLDSTRSYQPQVTLLEAMKYEQKKATGLVVTVEFPHATPADCSSHHYDRKKYEYLAPQIAYNNLDVVFGGGTAHVTNDMKEHFRRNGTTFIENDLKAFRDFEGDGKLWALFAQNALPFDLDADTTKIPSLAEMTRKAISRLSKNENGFFLMVEGSKVDYAAHSNDAIGCITEFIAFDKAVEVALDFAKKDGNTTVVVVPDHGNSGFTIGVRGKKYSTASLTDLFATVSKYRKTSSGLEEFLLKVKPDSLRPIFKRYTDIDLTDKDFELLMSSKNYHESDYMKVNNSVNMASSIVKIMNSYTHFGFTSGGHTGEDVFLAVYHPKGQVPIGMSTNIDLHNYMYAASGLKTPMNTLTDHLFAKHSEVFKGLKYSIDKTTPNTPVLIVKKGKQTLKVPAFKSIVYLDGKELALKSVTVYIDKNDTFYLPVELANYFLPVSKKNSK